MIEIEIRMLDLRYEGLRLVVPGREKRLLASLAANGQTMPVLVVEEAEGGGAPVLIDGYRRVRSLRTLCRDTVKAVRLELPELEALLLYSSLRSSAGETAIEQAWLLDELRQRFDLSLDDLARRFDRTVSWVSRRVSLVRELPQSVQDLIRQGRVVPYAAGKHLVPLARANRSQCERLAQSIAPLDLTSREIGEIYAGWRNGSATVRERIVEEPGLFLRTRAETASGKSDSGPRTGLIEDLLSIGGVARRASRRVKDGAVGRLSPPECEEILGALSAARAVVARLGNEIENAIGGMDAGRRSEENDLRVEAEGHVDPGDLPDPPDLEEHGEEDPGIGVAQGFPAREERDAEALA